MPGFIFAFFLWLPIFLIREGKKLIFEWKKNICYNTSYMVTKTYDTKAVDSPVSHKDTAYTHCVSLIYPPIYYFLCPEEEIRKKYILVWIITGQRSEPQHRVSVFVFFLILKILFLISCPCGAFINMNSEFKNLRLLAKQAEPIICPAVHLPPS